MILTELYLRSYDLLYKRNSRTFKHLDQKSAVFQGFQGLEKPVMNFKYFQALQGPVRTLIKQQKQQTFSSKLPIAKNCEDGAQATDLMPKARSYALNVSKHRPSSEYSKILYWKDKKWYMKSGDECSWISQVS